MSHDERFSRVVEHLGPDRFARLRGATATVVGLGGVGSHAALALARAGIGRLRLVDPDTISWSSLNRHACALPEQVGRLKIESVGSFLAALRPTGLELELLAVTLEQGNVEDVVGPAPGLVLDAIDGVSAKLALLGYCLAHAIPVVSSMGASSRSRPELLQVGELWSSRGCPLARTIRRALRRRFPELPRLPVVYSTEESPRPSTELPQDRSPGTPRRHPSLPTLPGIFGYSLANTALFELIGGRD